MTYMLEVTLVVVPVGETRRISRVNEALSLLVVVQLVFCNPEKGSSLRCHIKSIKSIID